jgi:trehalose 6-phosphate phosphatase
MVTMLRDEMVQRVTADPTHALIALDFDGTLAPIVKDPTTSRPTEGAIDAIAALARAGARIAVITGRDAATAVDLGGLAAVPDIVVAGLYGAETWHQGELQTPDQPPAVDELRAELPAVIAHGDNDLWIEDKRLSLVVHARLTAHPAEAIEAVRPGVEALAERLGLETHDGKGVLEIRLPGYDKGSVLRRLVDRFAPTSVLFAGDDLGDIPALEAVRDMRRAGIAAYGIAVVPLSSDSLELAVAADLRVDDPDQLVQLLWQLVPAADG